MNIVSKSVRTAMLATVLGVGAIGLAAPSFAQDPVTSTTYPANTVVLVRIGLKTIGDYYLRAL